MKLRWTPSAVTDLEDLITHIREENPPAAEHTGERLWEAAQLLQSNPFIGRSGRVSGTREWIIQNTPYFIAYRASEEAVVILRIRHTKRRWPA